MPATVQPIRPSPARRSSTRAGRAANAVADAIRRSGEDRGLMPHEILLSVARGEKQTGWMQDVLTGEWKKVDVYPDLAQRIDAASKAAPYYAPRLGVVEVVMKAADDELDEAIASIASAAGVAIAFEGESAA